MKGFRKKKKQFQPGPLLELMKKSNPEYEAERREVIRKRWAERVARSKQLTDVKRKEKETEDPNESLHEEA